jgi:hypothetical protein
MHEFFKEYDKDFFRGFVPLDTLRYDIAIIYTDGTKKEVYGIERPWAYMNEVKKNPNVKTCFIMS